MKKPLGVTQGLSAWRHDPSMNRCRRFVRPSLQLVA